MILKLSENLTILGQTASLRLRQPLTLLGKVERGGKAEPVATGARQVSQFWWNPATEKNAADEVSPLSMDDILPKEEELFFVSFRAISEELLEGYCVDYSKAGVLEASTALLNHQRVCKDHDYYNAEDAIGAIVSTEWDAKGEASNGVAGINARLFVDARIAPGIVRRLAYPVPAIHSVSVTVQFEWEPSHPALYENKTFWSLLGEEVDGEIVRIIATRIIAYKEISFVYEGAVKTAKRLPEPEATVPDSEDDDEEEELKKKSMAASQALPLPQEKTTVKLKVEDKQMLGLAAHEGDDLPEEVVLPAVRNLAALASYGQSQRDADRAELKRLLKLCEGENSTLLTLADNLPDEKLGALIAEYGEKERKLYPQTCQQCGSSNVQGRSSLATPQAAVEIGIAQTQRKRRFGLHG